MLLCDTGVLLAAGNIKDHAHQACLRLLRHAERPLPVPSPVLGEIGYLLQSRAGPQAEVTFLRSSGGDGFKVAELQGTGTGRMTELAETYLDIPPGIIDAAVAAIAERLGLTGIAALDHRHFTVIRPATCRYSRSCQVPGMPGPTPFCSCFRQETPPPHQALPQCHHAARQEDHRQRAREPPDWCGWADRGMRLLRRA